MDSRLRKETRDAGPDKYCPKGGTAYYMIYGAVKQQDGLIHGKLHDRGASCAIGSFFETNEKTSLEVTLIDEVAAVNDSVPHFTRKQRKAHVMRWLKWKLATLGMPGFKLEVPAPVKAKR